MNNGRRPGRSLARVATGLVVVLVVAASLAGAFRLFTAQGAPIVTTDKADYFSTDTAIITGSGFSASTSYAIPVIRPDGSIVKGDGSLTLGWDIVLSNGSGSFTYSYKLDGMLGTYTVRVYAASWSGDTSQTPLASTTFTDADIDFTQCANDSDDNGVKDDCSWINGALQPNNSVFTEGNSVPQRLFHRISSAGSHTLRLRYDFSKGDIYAYDFLTSADLTQSGSLLKECADLPGFVASATCTAMYSGAQAGVIPSDPFDAVAAREIPATRSFKVGCSTACSAGVTVSLVGHSPAASCFQNCGNSSVDIDVTVSTTAANTIVGLWFGGHLAQSADPDGGGPVLGWGVGCDSGVQCGAASVSGAPFHLRYISLDGGSVGNRDNQIQPGAVTPKGTITIVKDAVPNDPQDFTFSGGLGSFTLDDDSDGTLSNTHGPVTLSPGSYAVTESDPTPAFDLTSIVCTGDTDGGSAVNLGTRTVTIDLDNGEDITCTFTDTKRGKIVVVKDASPDNPQDFSFTSDVPGCLAFSLDDDAEGTLSNTQNCPNVQPGVYSVTETVPAGWTNTMISCVDPDAGSGGSPPTASIDLDAGETVTCTFTNGPIGDIIVIKDADPNEDPQAFSFSCSSPLGTFTLDDNSDPTYSSTKVFTGVSAGSYTCTETVPGGWSLTNLVCADPDNGSTATPPTANIDLDPGETVTCTFTDTKHGTIVVKKETNPDGDPQVFSFTSNIPVAGCASFSLSDGQSKTCTSFVPNGPYNVTENSPTSGWSPPTATCSDGSPASAIAVSPGETVTCTFQNTKLGKIKIIKDALPDDPTQDFAFSCPGLGSFSLDDDGNGTLPNTQTFDNVMPGAYTCTETVPGGWSLTGLVCADPDNGSTATPPTANIDLDPGETVTCTFTDTKHGTIIIQKETNPDGDPQVFSFTSNIPVAGCASFSLSDGQSKTCTSFLPGTFSVSEGGPPAGWSLTGATCTDGSPVSAIAVSAGETVTCTFTNTKHGTIIIQKQTNPDGDPQVFSFTSDIPVAGCASFSLSDGQSKTCTSFLPGTYSVSEGGPPAGWSLTGATCTDGSPVSAIAVSAGETVTCTFTNALAPGTITIIKDAVPNDAQDFCFTGALGPFCLDDDANPALSNTKTVSSLAPGTYAVTESAVAGWTTSSIACSDGSPVDLATRTASISLQGGENVTCTFTNSAGSGTITIKKDAVPDDAQDFSFTGSLGAFSLDDDSDPALSNAASFPGLSFGSYNVTEAPVPGWSITSITCSDGSPGGVGSGTAFISLQPGESVTCTFVNSKQVPPTPTPTEGPVGGQVELPVSAGGSSSGSTAVLVMVLILALAVTGALAAKRRWLR